MPRIAFLIMLSILFPVMLSGCANLRDEHVVYKTNKHYPPYTGKVKVYWKEYGVPADPNSYELIGTVSAKPFWAGLHEGKTYKPLHDFIIKKAGEMGGNAVIIYCGEIGSIAQAECYGDVLWMK